MAGAQTLDVPALIAAAQAGDPEAQRMVGEARVYGLGGAQDVPAGIALLEQAAQAGDLRAKASLGKILLDGFYLPAEPDRALPLLDEAAQAGDTRARTALGAALLWGDVTAPDPDRARALLQQAAQAGDVEALRILGEQLVQGWVMAPDTRTGLAMLEQAAATGDTGAQVALGAVLLDGPGVDHNIPRAVELFESAARAGDGAGLETYGAWLMWGQRDPARAETLLRRAGEMGRASAWTTLAEGAMYGYLPPNSRAKFAGFADRARAAGQDRIAVLDAERRMWGIGMRASGPKSRALLEQAAEAGNPDALRFLVRLLRDGNGMNVARDRAAARALLDRFADLLSPAERARLALTIDISATRQTARYPALADRLERDHQRLGLALARDLYAANPNFAIYLLQRDMARRGIYAGPLDALATSDTLRALHSDCMARLPDRWQCGENVMDVSVIGPLLARRSPG
ncbi:tetratricopeptide repeat protein [Rhodovulum marinum]|uniref:TPR repeat protein n=1 Tax=Rhodovulum marinum TaxID=320662 RepID=A0A4R2PZ03_9RHOB|nr:SEL1-like repeat protein [Rhodovulum marinum]TCP40594.1 TPR repeat protein [Rhodovulum marinum]